MSLSPSIELLTNGVIAQYIHEISVRHRPRSAADGRASAVGSPVQRIASLDDPEAVGWERPERQRASL